MAKKATDEICTCGHTKPRHEDTDKNYWGKMECNVKGCECKVFDGVTLERIEWGISILSNEGYSDVAEVLRSKIGIKDGV